MLYLGVRQSDSDVIQIHTHTHMFFLFLFLMKNLGMKDDKINACVITKTSLELSVFLFHC